MGRKSDAYYKQMARTLRSGFRDPEETDELQLPSKKDRERQGLPPLSKAEAIRSLRRAGYVIGKEVEFDPKTGVLTDVRRTGNIARGFGAVDGYDLRDVDEWTPQQKAKLTRTFNAVNKLASRPFQVYRPRKRENLAIVQKATHGTVTTPPELNIAFVPVAYPAERATVKIKKQRVTIKEREQVIPRVEVQERDIVKAPTLWSDLKLTMADVARDPRGAVRKMVEAIGGDRFTFLIGTRELQQALGPKGLEDELVNIMNQYPRWAMFVMGIQAFTMPPPRRLADYRTAKTASQDALTKQREKDRRRFRQKYGPKRRRRR